MKLTSYKKDFKFYILVIVEYHRNDPIDLKNSASQSVPTFFNFKGQNDLKAMFLEVTT